MLKVAGFLLIAVPFLAGCESSERSEMDVNGHGASVNRANSRTFDVRHEIALTIPDVLHAPQSPLARSTGKSALSAFIGSSIHARPL